MRFTLSTLIGTLLSIQAGLAVAQAAPGFEELELTSHVFHNTRSLHVLLPPSYHDPAHATTHYPVCYFLDGRAAFDSGGWDVPGTFTRLWAAHRIPEFIVVGIDNGGSTRESKNPGADRASEFLPYADQSWTEAPVPTPQGMSHPAFLFTEVIPAVAHSYRTVGGAHSTCLAGASYGGVAALYLALQYPDSMGAVLIESPSLQVGNGRMVQDADHQSRWPVCVYVGVGTQEGQEASSQTQMVTNATALAKALPADRSHFTVVPNAIHDYSAWRDRLPEALEFLLSGVACRSQTR